MNPSVALIASFIVAFSCDAGAASLAVVIGKLDASAAACGISKSQLDDAASRTLQVNGVQRADDADGQLHVRVTVTRRKICFAHISVRMMVLAKPLPSAEFTNPRWPPGLGVAVLCDKGDNYSAPKESFALEVESGVADSIRECLGSLIY